ncbi:MAG TPA: bifunctional phosphoglucose/phosphomannose isomerase [Solirubrobacterales bacterium]|nr:bifunctional phosphoglucose/phosphomannose isomerase [Solirubrobacterales bacterium]
MTVVGRNLDRETVLAVDASREIDDILAMPDHIEDALFKAESAMMAPADVDQLIICGMGGSAIGADLAVAAIGANALKPVTVVRGYDLPPWIGPKTAVLCSSYSGNTEETLACYVQAEAAGSQIFVASAGGVLSERAQAKGEPVIALPGILQPRASVGYGVTAALEVCIATGVIDAGVRDDLNAASAQLRELGEQWGPDGDADALPKRLARDGYGRVTVTYGAQLTAPVAYRWKTQINENAKVPAWTSELPEANHNEINAWGAAAELAEHCAWLLRDVDQNERNQRRIELTAQVIDDSGAKVEIVDTVGQSRLARQFSAVFLGDLVSLYLAILRDVDPTPVPIIEGLKDSLGRPS